MTSAVVPFSYHHRHHPTGLAFWGYTPAKGKKTVNTLHSPNRL
jgi:hypothetical protein